MLWSVVKNTQWAPMLDLLSPAFFDVVPARMLFGELRGLSSRYLSQGVYRDAVGHINKNNLTCSHVSP